MGNEEFINKVIPKDLAKFDEMSINYILDVFYLLGTGYALSLIVFTIECLRKLGTQTQERNVLNYNNISTI